MEDLIGVTEAARRLGMSKEWIQKLCQQGRIEGARKIGKQWILPAGAAIAAAEPRAMRMTEIPRASPLRGKGKR